MELTKNWSQGRTEDRRWVSLQSWGWEDKGWNGLDRILDLVFYRDPGSSSFNYLSCVDISPLPSCFLSSQCLLGTTCHRLKEPNFTLPVPLPSKVCIWSIPRELLCPCVSIYDVGERTSLGIFKTRGQNNKWCPKPWLSCVCTSRRSTHLHTTNLYDNHKLLSSSISVGEWS